MIRRCATAVGAVLLCGLTAVLGAAPAAAATARNGVCEAGELCLYFNSGQQGSLADLAGSNPSYGTDPAACVTFVSAGNGRGKCVKNNAASAWNRESAVVTVFYKSGYAGAIDSIAAGAKADLSANLKNENAGHLVGTAGATALSTALYKTSGGHISAYFDGYLSTSGRHEGIDIARSIGSPVYALVAGTVINVVRGSTGSNGLSTIAVYNASLDRTVIYLHSAPLASVGTGDTIGIGQQIATESWHGVSSSGSAHTHVEMRPGRHTLASVSVGDPTLDNPIPTSFWTGRGYTICCS